MNLIAIELKSPSWPRLFMISGTDPFSHAFESVQKARGASKKHEIWTTDLVLNPKGEIYPILEKYREGISKQIADLLAIENPRDEYHAIVSSSFDADRLDYLRRDRLMTGSGAGAIDFDWLIDNIRIATVLLAGDNDEDGMSFTTFCLDQKALQAAEAFLIARYHLFEQVYLHKTTRGVERIIQEIFDIVAKAASKPKEIKELGLGRTEPLIRFFAPKGDTIDNYLALDDFVVWTSITRIADGKNERAAELARRLLNRRLLKALDVNAEFPVEPEETLDQTETRRQNVIADIEKRFAMAPNETVLKDVSKLDVYGEIGSDEAKQHKKISILLRNGTTREITQLSPTIKTLIGRKTFVRYYCGNDSVRKLGLGGDKNDDAR